MIDVTNNGTSIAEWIKPQSLIVRQQLTNEPDTAQFSIILKTGRTAPTFNDDVIIYDGSTKIFAGKVVEIKEAMKSAVLPFITVHCVDHTFEFDRKLAAKTYTDQTIQQIISDMAYTAHGTTFGTTYAVSTFVIEKIVFNQVPLSQCMRRLADIVRYDWYIDEDKQIHFFPKNTNLAPYDLSDTNGNHVFNSLNRSEDGSQIVNRVKVRGGEYNGDTYTDIITVTGTPLSFVLPYKFANLTIETDQAGAGTFTTQTIGIDFIDTFDTDFVLYNFQTQSFRFGTPLTLPARVRFTGNPKVPVLSIAEDAPSVLTYGAIEKMIRDDSIVSNEVARKRAAGELLAFTSLVVDSSFETYTAGLRTGMLINIASSSRGFDDDLIIKRITFKARTNTTYDYQVECISTQRYTLLDLLRKIITPDPKSTDENETSEQIYAINEAVVITDAWTQGTPWNIAESISIADVYQGTPGANIVWVYGYYAPTSINDPKRMGKYDRDTTYA